MQFGSPETVSMTTSAPDATRVIAGVDASKKPHLTLCGVASTLIAVSTISSLPRFESDRALADKLARRAGNSALSARPHGLPVARALKRVGRLVQRRFLPLFGDEHEADGAATFAESAGDGDRRVVRDVERTG